MPPRPGRAYATQYYLQPRLEYDRTHLHVIEVARAIIQVTDTDPEWNAWCGQPLRAFARSQRGRYYSLMEIVTDMLTQFSLGRDIPSGMLGRWNRLFEHTPWDIVMVDHAVEHTEPPTLFQELFDATIH